MSIQQVLSTGIFALDADTITRLGLIIAILGLIVALAAAYYARIPIIENWKLRRDSRRLRGFQRIDLSDCVESLRYYIEPDCCTVDPSGEDDLRALLPSRQPIHALFDEIFTRHTKYRHVLVLADSGMGKTSLLYSLLLKNSLLPAKKHLPMAFVSLSKRDSLLSLADIQTPRAQTILLLDAYDEDPLAVNDLRNRLDYILSQCSDFKRIVITCRTQFFAHDEEIPIMTGIVKLGPRSAGDSGELLLYKLYLAPLTSTQVERWLRKRFGLFRWRKKRIARTIIERIPELSVRPMLLVVIPDLIEDEKFIESIYELYGYMVSKWLIRESRWIGPNQLLLFSRRIAVDIFCNRTLRQSERIPRLDFEEYLKTAPLGDAWKFQSRSLLNRDSEGNFKFAHRSFMEFMFVEAFLGGDRKCLTVAWTEQMIQFMWEAVSIWTINQGSDAHTPGVDLLASADTTVAGLIQKGKELKAIAHWGKYSKNASLPRAEKYAKIFVRAVSIMEILVVCDVLNDRVIIFAQGPLEQTVDRLAVHAFGKGIDDNSYGVEAAWVEPDIKSHLAGFSEVNDLISLDYIRTQVAAVKIVNATNSVSVGDRRPLSWLCVSDKGDFVVFDAMNSVGGPKNLLLEDSTRLDGTNLTKELSKMYTGSIYGLNLNAEAVYHSLLIRSESAG